MAETALPLAQKAAQLFADKGIESARLESELLLAHALGIKRLDLYLQFERPLTEAELERFRQLVRRRLKREPLQFITGKVQFREIELSVDARALIPRPETEVLVGEVVHYAHSRPEALRCVDIGTGTGAIALSVARECPNVSVLATDVSAEALELARSNSAALGVNVETANGDLWAAVASGDRFDIVVSNPPYIAESERSTLQPEVRDFEPAQALFGGADGLSVIRRLIEAAPPHMNAGGLLAIEIGMTQAAEVQELIAATSSFETSRVVRDLSGRDRIVTAICRKHEA